MGRTRVRGGWLWLIVPMVLVGCDEDDLLGTPDPALDPMVGAWNATEFRVSPAAAPALGFDVIAQGGTFAMEIEPSGRYAAVLGFEGLVSTELGVVTVDGNQLIQTPQSPPGDPVTIDWSMPGPDRLILDGESEFDFDQNGTPDPAIVHIDLTRAPGS